MDAQAHTAVEIGDEVDQLLTVMLCDRSFHRDTLPQLLAALLVEKGAPGWRSAAEAAERIGVAESTISRARKRVRQIFYGRQKAKQIQAQFAEIGQLAARCSGRRAAHSGLKPTA